MITFTVAFRETFELADLIELVKLTAQFCKPVEFHFEFTEGLEQGRYTEKSCYSERIFHSFEALEQFSNQTELRFDGVRLIQKQTDHFLSLGQSAGRFSLFGRQKDTSAIEHIVDLVDENIKYAFIHDELDSSLGRVPRYRDWKRRLGKVPNYVRYYDNPRWGGGERDPYLIDLESVPTHHHFIRTGDQLWFGACAVMYFSDLYYKYIPKEKWDRYSDCVENTVLKNGLRKITLYTDFADCENITHRDRQWQFRRQLDIDTVAHKENRVTPISEDLLIPVQTGETSHLDWSDITDVLDALQISSGQTYGKEKLGEILTQLDGDKVILVKLSDSSKILKSREDLQSLIDSYDARIVISKIL